jgi:uncharacterized protein (DUF1330 family)
MRHIEPSENQLNMFLEKTDDSKPLVMINLLKFKRSNGDPEEGINAYSRYMSNVAPFLSQVGGRLLWLGDVDQVFIGSEENDAWDRVLLVEYPSRKAFLEMVSNPEYQKIHQDRDAALEDSALLPSKTILSMMEP